MKSLRIFLYHCETKYDVMKILSYPLIGFFILLFTIGCSSNRISYIVSCNYDNKKDITTYTKLPLGSVNIPGEWEQGAYNNSSKQQYFINQDSVIMSIAIVPANGFAFNRDNSKKGFEFTKSFFEWDSQYLSNTNGLQVNVIEEDSVKNYILWTIYGDVDGTQTQNYFLFGESNGIAKNYSIQVSKGWSKTQIISFLKNLYLN